MEYMSFREEKAVPEDRRKVYADGIEKLISRWNEEDISVRDGFVRDIFKTPEKYREKYKEMLGRPLTEYKYGQVPPNVTYEKELFRCEDYTITRMSFEILDGLSMTGLLFKHDDKKRPLVIVQHGGLGTPELISKFYGRTGNYNDIVERTLKNGLNVFAPQLLIWNNDEFEPKFERARLDARLKRVGSSITAIEIYGIMRIIDYFEATPYTTGFGMIGLSYGGFYTLFTTACDTRIKSAIACSQFNRRDKYDWPDWTWFRASKTFSDAEIACLVYPRKLVIEVGASDELFDVKYANEEFSRLEKLCEKVGTDWVKYISFDGVHEYCHDDAPVEELAKTLFELQ